MVLQQWLRVFPTRQRTNSTNLLDLNHVLQRIPCCIPKYSALHVCRLQFSSGHLELARSRYDSLCDVEGVLVILRETQAYGNVAFCSCGADSAHLGGVDSETVLHIRCLKVEVHWPRPGGILEVGELVFWD